MSLRTHSKFYYDYEVSDENNFIDFDEGGGELTAELEIGNYTLTEYVDEIERALNEAGALTYTVTVNRTTRVITISAGSNFELLVSSGSHLGTSAYGTIGFTGADRSGDDSYAANAASGFSYDTQFILQSYVDPQDFKDSTYGTVNQSASGNVEVVSFGQVSFIEANIMYANDNDNGAGGFIRTNASGVANLRQLMQYLITKGPLEFMPDEDDPSTFYKIILESTPDDPKGLKYKLREQYGRGLPGYFDTGILKFRVIE